MGGAKVQSEKVCFQSASKYGEGFCCSDIGRQVVPRLRNQNMAVFSYFSASLWLS